MSKRKFEEFFYQLDNRIHSFEEVDEVYNSVDSSLSDYMDYMLCPECKKAQLTYRHGSDGRKGFLAKIPSASHEEWCTYNYDEAKKEVVEKYIKSLSPEQVTGRLETAINLLIREQNNSTVVVEADKENLKKTFLIPQNNSKSTYKSIPRKKLNAWFERSELEGKAILFYGKVKLKVKTMVSKNNWEYHMLDIYTKRRKDAEWCYKVSVYRGRTVDKISEDNEYAIALIGYLEYEYGYMQLKLLNPFAIKIEELS